MKDNKIKPCTIDLTGEKFSELKVLEFSFYYKKKAYFSCLCKCGNIINVASDCLKSGNTKSCGCLRNESTIKRSTKHGMATRKNPHPLYNIYNDIKKRCYYLKNKRFKNYGGRGITVCDEWLGENGFLNFYNWAVANGWEKGLSIERKDVNGNYESGNCIWIPMSKQARNTTRTKKYTVFGTTDLLDSLVNRFAHHSLSIQTVIMRIWRGWDVEKALLTPKTRNRLKKSALEV